MRSSAKSKSMQYRHDNPPGNKPKSSEATLKADGKDSGPAPPSSASASTNDHFHTPQNAEFYRRFNYAPLTPGAAEIRLLRINGLGQHRHSLVSKVPICHAPRYIALSYCAGDPKDVSEVWIDGIQFNAFRTLATAIKNACDFQRERAPKAVLYLWADQICINQSDKSERTRQVNIMREIYGRAHQVLVSLKLSSKLYDGVLLYEGTKRLTLLLTNDGLESIRAKIHKNSTEDPEYMLLWSVFHAIIHCQWWQRAWIFQEFLMADRATFMLSTGSNSVHLAWRQVCHILEAFYTNRDSHRRMLGSFPKEVDELPKNNYLLPLYVLKPLVTGSSPKLRSPPSGDEAFCRWIAAKEKEPRLSCYAYLRTLFELPKQNPKLNHQIQSDTFRHSYSSLLKEYQALTQAHESVLIKNTKREKRKQSLTAIHASLAANMDSRWTIVDFVLTSKRNYEPDYPIRLSQLMKHAHNCLSSDPRDKIYAFLGLTEPGHGIEPAYDITLNTVRIRTAQAVMRMDKNLDILISATENTYLNTSDDLLPSWVPEFWSASSKRNATIQRFRQNANLESRNHRAGGTAFQNPQFLQDRSGHPGMVMETQGLYLDTLGKLLNDEDDDDDGDDGLLRVFAGKDSGMAFNFLVPSKSQRGDEVWVLIGAREPFVLRRWGSDLTIIGNAMVQQPDANGQYVESLVMMGSWYEEYERGSEIRTEHLRLI